MLYNLKSSNNDNASCNKVINKMSNRNFIEERHQDILDHLKKKYERKCQRTSEKFMM